ncbi:unnamed protein product [Pelagomonas calceolata]|uniref:Uncharacterized protein n=3 Tax=Pelagomonas calceolata TaxID=35677 RepID=A0A8J2SHW1_9STRA|nr:unnamed protein product [Pelagomonas calceolata]
MATLLTFLGRTLYQHRPFNDVDEAHIRRVSNGANVAAAANPGLRVIPGFVAADELDEVASCARECLDRYGRQMLRPRDKAYFEGQMAHLTKSERPFVNAERVTGRFERPDQPLAPWGHGDEFDVEALPAVLRKLAERARASPLALGPLRDVTINRRRDGYFRLDPHLDPAKDGPNVCIVGLLSDTVLTLSPVGPPDSTTCDQEAVSMNSWDAADVDVLATIGTLVHLSGKARMELHHGIRLGVSRRQLSEAGVDVDGDVLYDWWGAPARPMKRNRERISIVFAFGEPSLID